MAELQPQTFRLAIGQAATLVVTMDAEPADGTAGWTMRFRFRRRGQAVAIEKATASGITNTDDVAGIWEVVLVGDDTDELGAGVYDWAFWRTDTDDETPLAYGTCTVYRTAETG